MNVYFMYRSKLPKPVYTDSSLDKLLWKCSAWPIESLETSYDSLDLYKKYAFSQEATSPFHVSWPRLAWLQKRRKTITENQKLKIFRIFFRKYIFRKLFPSILSKSTILSNYCLTHFCLRWLLLIQNTPSNKHFELNNQRKRVSGNGWWSPLAGSKVCEAKDA